MGCDGARWVAMGCVTDAMGRDGLRWGAMGCDGLRDGCIKVALMSRDGCIKMHYKMWGGMCRVTECEKKESIIIVVNFSQVICFKNVKRFGMRVHCPGFTPPLC